MSLVRKMWQLKKATSSHTDLIQADFTDGFFIEDELIFHLWGLDTWTWNHHFTGFGHWDDGATWWTKTESKQQRIRLCRGYLSYSTNNDAQRCNVQAWCVCFQDLEDCKIWIHVSSTFFSPNSDNVVTHANVNCCTFLCFYEMCCSNLV